MIEFGFNRGPEKKVPTPEEEWVEDHKDDPNFDPKEFKSHQDRFKAQAEEHAGRSVLRRVLDRNKDKEAEDFAYEEALRDNEEWNKMYHLALQDNGEYKKEMNAEYKEWHKMLQVVLDDLKKCRDNPESKEAKEFRPLLLALGGGMAGCQGGGQVAALVHTEYMKVFKQAVGVSAGACDIAYAMGGREQVLLGNSMYYEECATLEFLNLKRVRQVMNVGVLSDVMEGAGPKRLDTESITAHPAEFYVQATNVATGESEFIDAKHNDKGIVEAVHASMALPWFYRKSVRINGQDYVDGAFESFPIEEVIKRFNPTHVLVLPQVPFENMVGVEKEAKMSRALASLIPRKGSLNIGSMALAEKFIKSREGFRKGLEHIQEETGVKIGIMYPPNSGISPITNEPQIIKASIWASAKKACEDLGEKMNFELK